MYHRLLFSLLLLLFFFTSPSLSSSFQPDRFLKPTFNSLRRSTPQQYIELKLPLQSDNLIPSCTLSVLQHSFADTLGKPPVSVSYSPPSDCPSPWSHVVLQMDVTCQGEQYDRIAAIWLAGSELLRTSTAEPTDSGIFWTVRKDVTRYSSLLAQSDLALSMMLENLVNDVYTGVYHVNVTLLFYKDEAARVPYEGSWIRKLGLESDNLGNIANGRRNALNSYEKPADLIVPVSDQGHEGFWFRIQNGTDVRSKSIRLPRNARRIVLELYVSFHGDDEFWYSNPPDVYIKSNNLTTKRGGGSVREVFVRIDGRVVAAEIPFPVIFTGGINPLFWEPVVAIGAFDVPSYDLDLTPFLGSLLDGKSHTFELGVTNAIQFWLVNANLHIWLDHQSSRVKGKTAVHRFPDLHQSWEWEFKQLDGSFHVEAKRKSISLGWVFSSSGNLTTKVSRKIKFKNWIKFDENGTYKMVQQKFKDETEVTVKSVTGMEISQKTHKRKYPLIVIISTLPGLEKDTYLLNTNVSHSMKEKSSDGNFSNALLNSQESGGWLLVKDHSVLTGTADTRQRFNYWDHISCYSRDIEAASGQLLRDVSASGCPSLLNELLNKFSYKTW
ncbi:hypothetical protein Nepgr_028658 [Nepenthes gracilis]|uniref:Peptide N-acetyl-beta-D-glucosaminyl asparaginase amidase A N-terminal domain-containing protein n=1 Tax=Nepenthes gracilis TaxID=150966 RepID=A0AAD3TC35_NEPGR|nr:hypothetical protein Nepgr_028658 [Nepenthes gracilis]